MSEYVRIKNADQDLMTDVIQQARGLRGYSDFANDCGYTFRHLMRVIRKEFVLPYYPEDLIRSIAQHKDASVEIDEESFLAVNGEVKKVIWMPCCGDPGFSPGKKRRLINLCFSVLWMQRVIYHPTLFGVSQIMTGCMKMKRNI